MKRLLFLLLFIPVWCGAATWFVSPSGSDSNSGTSSGSPFLTLAHVQTAYHAGDIIELQCNGTYAGTLTISSASQIIKYGSGTQPIISGFDVLNSWTSVGTNLWRIHDANLGATVKVFVINGTQYAPGRFPKATYATYTASSGNTSITSAGLAGTWGANAQVVIRKNHFNLSTYQISSVVGNVVTYSGGSGDTPIPGSGAFIQNSLNALSQNGDWYFDGAGNITLYWVGTPPVNIQASRYDKLINVTSGSGAIVNGINFTGANGYGVYANNTTNIQVLNSTFTLCDVGSLLNNNTNAIISSNIYSQTNGNGFTATTSTNLTMTGCSFTNIALIPGLATEYSAMRVVPISARNTIVTTSTVNGAGYNGFFLEGSFTATHLIGHGSCQLLDDGANLYEGVGHTPATIPASIISNCIFFDAIGNGNGTNDGKNEAVNLYLDDNSNHITISNTTCYNAGQYDYFLHNSQFITVSNCTGYSAGVSVLSMVHDGLGAALSNITLSNNQFINLTSFVAILKPGTANANDLKTAFTGSNQKYANTSTLASPFQTQLLSQSVVNRNLASWQTATATDGSSSYVTSPSPSNFYGNPSSSALPVVLSGVWKDLDGTSYSGTINIPAYGSLFLYFFGSTPIAPPNISVSPTTYSFPINLPISSINFTNTGGAATFTISPTQVASLVFNTSNGQLSGIPSVVQGSTAYLVTATNVSGSSHVTINIAVFTNPTSSVIKITGLRAVVK